MVNQQNLKNSKQELLKEFNDFYINKAMPLLPEYEIKRKQDLPVYVSFSCLMFFFAAIFASSIMPEIDERIILFLVIGLFLSVGAIAFFSRNKENNTISCDYEIKLKTTLMPDFLNIFGSFVWTKFDAGKNYWKYFCDLRKDKVFPLNYILSIDDTICGNFKDVPINIYEVKATLTPSVLILLMFIIPFFCIFVSAAFGILGFVVFLLFFLLKVFALLIVIPILCFGIIKAYKFFSVYDKFKGVVVEFKMNKNFSGKTFLYERKHTNRAVKNMNKDGYSSVILEDVEFNKKFETFSTDQIEARYLLTTAFMERLKNIELAFKAEFIRASFRDDKLFLVIGVNKDLFAMGNIHKQSNSNTFQELFNEMYSVLELVDELKLNQHIGM